MTEANKKPAKATTPVKLLYATWDGGGVRHEPGVVIDVPFDMAREMIAAKKAERADPFPGEQK